MKNYSKFGGRKGKPGYRTPSRFLSRKHVETLRAEQRGERKQNYGKRGNRYKDVK